MAQSGPYRAAFPVLLLGAFPPQAQGIPGYCGALAEALARYGLVRAIGFKAMYPRWLFPGVKAAMDPTSAVPVAGNLSVRHVLAWYNPAGWLWHALRTPAGVVHIQWWSLPLFPVCLTFALAARMRGIPVVVTVHNVLPHEPSPWFLHASRLLYRFADHLLVHSDRNGEQLRSHFSVARERISCVPMGAAGAPQTADARDEVRRRFGLPPDATVILFFGTLRAYKGLDVLLHAFARVQREHPSLRLIIAGKPWEPWAPYQAILDAEGIGPRVHLQLDYVPEAETAALFAVADVAVLPYRHFDAQSAAGAQMLGYGLPIIVSDVGGLPELVGGAPQWIAASGDITALAERLAWFATDPARATAAFAAAVESTRTAMSWEASAAAHWDVYRAVHATRPGGQYKPVD